MISATLTVQARAAIETDFRILNKKKSITNLNYSSPPQLRYPQLSYFHRNAILNWVPNPDLSYFELSYDFWEDNDGVGRGTTVYW